MEEIIVFFNVLVKLKVPKEMVETYKNEMNVGELNDKICEMAFEQCNIFDETDYEIDSIYADNEKIY